MKIHAAIFDIGNVILPFDYLKAANRLIELNRPAVEPDRMTVVAAKQELELGRIDRAEFLRRVKPVFEHKGSDEEFLAIWEDIFTPNPPMNELIERLAAMMPVYLLSNISDIHRESIHRDHAVFGHFRGGIFSYEVGLLKPDPAIFQLAAERFGVNPAETLYIDDMPENAVAAREAGFVVVHYDHLRHPEALAQIEELLSPV